jgi:D-tyrosyl-tRNA(Tyr) deacylase
LRAVLQRVKHCSVSVGGRVHSETGIGLLVLLGIGKSDTEDDAEYLADKILNLRIFPDAAGKMNLSLLDTRGEVMVVSQFTLLADSRKGRRPSFAAAADPVLAEPLYLLMVKRLESTGLNVQTGAFGELMDVSLDNWGPVTLLIDTPSGA